MQAKGSRIENHAAGLPEMRKAAPGGGQRPHLVGPPSIAEFHAAVTRHRKAAITTTGRARPVRVTL
jgi:hypothetical protein